MHVVRRAQRHQGTRNGLSGKKSPMGSADVGVFMMCTSCAGELIQPWDPP